MPSNMVKSFAKRTGHSVAEVESKWDEAKRNVTDGGTPESHRLFYPKVVTALKRMLGMKEEHMFMDKFMRLLAEDHDAPFITDAGTDLDMHDQHGKKVGRLPRYGVWKHDPAKGKHQVVETGDDLEALAKKHGIPAKAHRITPAQKESLDEAQPKRNQLVPPHEENIAGQMKDSIDDGYNWIVAATQAMRQHGINRDIAVEIFKRRFGVHPRSHQTRVQRGSRHDAPDPKDPAA